MATRYVSTSEKTKILARAIALYAAVQDLRGDDHTPEARATREAWVEWRTSNEAKWVAFVEREQFALFDRVGAL